PTPTPSLFPYTTLFRSDPDRRRSSLFHRRREYPGDIFSVLRDSVRRGTGTYRCSSNIRRLPHRPERYPDSVFRQTAPLQRPPYRSEEHTSELQSRFDLV